MFRPSETLKLLRTKGAQKRNHSDAASSGGEVILRRTIPSWPLSIGTSLAMGGHRTGPRQKDAEDTGDRNVLN